MTSLAEALLSPAGAALLDLVAQAREAGEPPLKTAARLRRDHPADLVAAASAEDELRVAARAKFSRAARMLFTRPGLEQASSETTARHRAARLAAAARMREWWDIMESIQIPLPTRQPGEWWAEMKLVFSL